MGFKGNFEHTLDDRGRVALPAKYRDQFGSRAVLTMSPDGCVQVFTAEGFDRMSEDVAKESPKTLAGRRARRLFDGQAFDAELDRQGRILIPAKFRERAHLNGAVVIVGCTEWLEIWEPSAWEAELQAAVAASSSEQGPEG